MFRWPQEEFKTRFKPEASSGLSLTIHKDDGICYTVHCEKRTNLMNDTAWMLMALEEAARAEAHDDVPVGAVAVYQGRVIGRGRNRREIDHDPLAHAEMIALREASRYVNHWRLDEVTLYCTLEPCAMCAGAMVLARLPRLVYAASDPKAGAGGSIMDILNHPRLNHHVAVSSGVLGDEAAALLVSFFGRLRAAGQRH
jgi:tRNA(adenine34) deaminase